MPNKELMQELEKEFGVMKKDLGFKATLEELDSIFFLRDFIGEHKFVSSSLSRMVCARIVNTLNSWANYLHGIIMPHPQNMFSGTETKMFSEDDKKELYPLLDQIMELSSRNGLIGLTKNKTEEAKFIDDAVNFWKSQLKPKLIELMTTVNKKWSEQAN